MASAPFPQMVTEKDGKSWRVVEMGVSGKHTRHFHTGPAHAGAQDGFGHVVLRANNTAWCVTHEHNNDLCIRVVRKALRARADRTRYVKRQARQAARVSALATPKVVYGSTA